MHKAPSAEAALTIRQKRGSRVIGIRFWLSALWLIPSLVNALALAPPAELRASLLA